VVGGIAASFYGEPRTTVDLDIALKMNVDDVEKLYDLLERGGYIASEYPPAPDLMERQAFSLIDERNRVRIDLLINPAILDEEGISRRQLVDLKHGWGKLWFLSAEDLIIMKIMTRRPRDFEDIKHMMAKLYRQLDLEYLKRRAKKLGVLLEIEELLRKYGAK